MIVPGEEGEGVSLPVPHPAVCRTGTVHPIDADHQADGEDTSSLFEAARFRKSNAAKRLRTVHRKDSLRQETQKTQCFMGFSCFALKKRASSKSSLGGRRAEHHGSVNAGSFLSFEPSVSEEFTDSSRAVTNDLWSSNT